MNTSLSAMHSLNMCIKIASFESEYSISRCNSYTMDCPPVRGDNPRALASRLSYVQVDKHGINMV